MNYNIVESNMKMRRNQLVKALEGTGCIPLCITGFPRLVLYSNLMNFILVKLQLYM